MTPVLRMLARLRLPIALSFIVLTAGLVGRRADAQTTPHATPYQLEPQSSYNVGCYGPCDCAVRGTPMDGGFRLRFLSIDPLYTNYAVEEFRASLRTDSGLVELHGAGEYRIGGEFALTEQLRLRLVYPDGSTNAFDSGVVPGGASFPALKISAAAHGFACYDTVIDVVAKPLTAGVPGPDGPRLALRAAPNPFRGETSIECTLAHPARVDVAVFDLQGREVATLARGLPLEPGSHALSWDGRGADRSPVRAGVYLAILRLPGATVTQRVVRLE